MEQPFVTIGIPVYNVGQFIGLTLKSVLSQTFTNFELIITDDGSTDNTVEIIRLFKDPRIRLFADGENRGISYRLNQQIDLAKGKYYVRMDGDDVMFPNRVEKEVYYLEEHPEVDVVGTGAVIIDEDNNIIGQRSSQVNCTRPEDVINNTPFIHPTVCGKIEYFRNYKYDEMLNGVEDKDLWCRGLVGSVYACIPEPLLFYRDPLKLKLSTYLSRQKKGRKQVFLRWHLFNQKLPAIKYVKDTYVKSIIAWVLCKLGAESLLVAKRNTIDLNSAAHQATLNQIIKNSGSAFCE